MMQSIRMRERYANGAPKGLSCSSKVPYRSKKFAAMIASKQSKVAGVKLEAYHCEGHHWHIGRPLGGGRG